MFVRNNHDDLPYPISPRDVHQYEDRLKTNINLFSFFDEGKARYPLYSSRTNYQLAANLLYWNEHYAPIKNISRLFSDVSGHKAQKYFASGVWATSKPKRS